MLVILDGFGYSPDTQYNAIAQAKKPFIDFALQNFPHTLLDASGPAVGLPEGYAGNSEVGHGTIGAGKRNPSVFLQLMTAIQNKSFFTNPTLVNNLHHLAHAGKTLHILGILSDAGVHGDMHIILAIIKAALEQKVKKIIIHAFLDGQDVPENTAPSYLSQIQKIIDTHRQVSIGSITGRWYAMAPDNDAKKTGATFDMLIHPEKPEFSSWQQALATNYQKKITDTYVRPTLLEQSATIHEGDGLIFTNFRQERERPLVNRFLQSKLKYAFLLTPIQYDPHFKNPTLLDTPIISGTLKEKISAMGKTIFSIAETEKYAHVTFFFDGGHEQPFPGEIRLLIPSPTVANFANTPEMSAQKITDAVLNSLHTTPQDFYLINYANADMVGHSGNFKATIKGVECVDEQLKQLYEQLVVKMDGILIITADHGNAEKMVDEKTTQPYPGHTINKVPFILIKNALRQKKIDLGIHELADVASIILKEIQTLNSK